ncbi:MAG TPA: hypothetical protein VKB86_11015 [Pyrinomonadaceae bacterium]|nr:hypothetical protein [Pyrinomonadaceae bacterium]
MKRYFAALLLSTLLVSLTFSQTNAVLIRDDDDFAGPVRSVRTEAVSFSRQNDEYVEGSRILVQTRNYSSDGRQFETIFYKPDGSVRQKEVRIYNEQGKWTEWDGYDANGSLLFRKLNNFDQGGRITEEITLNADATIRQRKVLVWSPGRDRITEIDTYNSEGAPVRKDVSHYDYRNKKLIWNTEELGGRQGKQTFDLTGNDPRRRIEESVGSDVKGSVVSTFNDSAAGQQVNNTIYNSAGEAIEQLPINREYDSHKNVIKETHLVLKKGDEKPQPIFVLYNTISYY